MSNIEEQLDATALIQKAIDEATLPNSVLNRVQSNRFIDLMINESTLLSRIRTSRVDHAKGEINKLDLGSISTEGAAESVSTFEPTESKVEYDTVKLRSAFDLTSDFVEDNLQGSSIRDLIMGMFSKRVRTDVEIQAIEGDETIGGVTVEAKLLKYNDGFLKLLTDTVPGAQQIDAAGAASTKRLFYDMKRKTPSRYRVAKPLYRWLVSSATSDKWDLDTSDRETQEGDRALVGAGNNRPFGVRMEEVPLFPEDLSVSSSVTDGTKIVMSPLNNLIWFIQRGMKIEWDRNPRADKWEVTIHTRVDYAVENADMVVLSNNVSESSADYTG